MKNNQTYRQIIACFLAGLVCLVFVLQSVHHTFGHDHIEVCSLKTPHFHAEGHEHFSCNICFFHFDASDLSFNDLKINVPNVFAFKLLFSYTDYLYSQSLLQTHPRGPPTILS